MAGEGLVAQIIVDKYMDHLPLHQQSQRFAKSRVGYCLKHHQWLDQEAWLGSVSGFYMMTCTNS